MRPAWTSHCNVLLEVFRFRCGCIPFDSRSRRNTQREDVLARRAFVARMRPKAARRRRLRNSRCKLHEGRKFGIDEQPWPAVFRSWAGKSLVSAREHAGRLRYGAEDRGLAFELQRPRARSRAYPGANLRIPQIPIPRLGSRSIPLNRASQTFAEVDLRFVAH